MSEERPCRDKEWWEHYPLHKWWCNDVCPLVPRWHYREGDEWNATIGVFTGSSFMFGRWNTFRLA